MQKCAASSLIEYITALALSSLLISIALSWLAQCHQQWRVIDAMIKLNERGRLVTQILRHASEYNFNDECSHVAGMKTINQNLPSFRLEPLVLLKYNSPLVAEFRQQHRGVNPLTDMLVINKPVGPCFTLFIERWHDRELNFPSPHGLKSGSEIKINNQQYQQFVSIDAVIDSHRVHLNQALSHKLPGHAHASKYETEWFFIADTRRRDQQGIAVYGLYHWFVSRDHQTDPLELLDYVESIQVVQDEERQYRGVDVLLRSEESVPYGKFSMTFNHKQYDYRQPILLKALRLLLK